MEQTNGDETVYFDPIFVVSCKDPKKYAIIFFKSVTLSFETVLIWVKAFKYRKKGDESLGR